MKKITRFLFLLLFSFSAIVARADEGMWLPLLLGKQVYADMVKKGLKLTPQQLYAINQASLKDAIIIFGGGCTGEMVSAEGLVFTNHHCGYNAIATASSTEHNYLRDGFYAKNKSEEIPTDISVQFLLKIDDVTDEVLKALSGLVGAERLLKQQEIIQQINQRYSDASQSIEARVSALFKGNQFMVFVYQRYRDVRLVGTPPESIGKFGGDTDNWEWPRHTGDFSIFRVYADNGKPSVYQQSNTPLKPKWFLPVSLKPKKEGDFVMTWGYPGSTNRYESSFGVKLATDINNPTLVKLRDIRLKYMLEEMKKDAAVKLKLASNYAGIANYWKFFDGETKQLLQYDVYGQKQKAEQEFQAWAKGKPAYQNLFSDWSKAYDEWRPYAASRVYLTEGILGSPLLKFASDMMEVETKLAKNETVSAAYWESINTKHKQFIESEDIPSDLYIVGAMLDKFYRDVPKDQQPSAFYESLKSQVREMNKEVFQACSMGLFSQTFFLKDDAWKNFIAKPDAATLTNDIAFQTVKYFVTNYKEKIEPKYKKFSEANAEFGRLYIKGILEKDPVKAQKLYPDATFTMRVSYGEVKAYKPKDACFYDYVTTGKGILEKYIPGDYEFDLPANQLSLMKKKDYGRYADAVRKDLVVGFITTNDITGGNSGSPVINGNGELVGLAFDGNYEALSHKIAFDKELNRTICVDIRYVLWCIDKVGGAPNIIQELKIVQ